MSDLKPQAESLESLLSTAIGLLMSHKECIGYKPNSVIAKFVDECVERLKDWPYTTAAQPAQAGHDCDCGRRWVHTSYGWVSTEPAQAGQGDVARDADVEAAAKKMAEIFDYPWDFMPEKGRNTMRENVRAVLTAAQGEKP